MLQNKHSARALTVVVDKEPYEQEAFCVSIQCDTTVKVTQKLRQTLYNLDFKWNSLKWKNENVVCKTLGVFFIGENNTAPAANHY